MTVVVTPLFPGAFFEKAAKDRKKKVVILLISPPEIFKQNANVQAIIWYRTGVVLNCRIMFGAGEKILILK